MMSVEEQARRYVWPTAAFVVVGNAVTIALETVSGRVDEAFFTLFLLAFPVVGVFVLSRRPDARLGWLMVAMGVVNAFLGMFLAYGAFAVERELPLGPLALALGGPGWVPFIGISGYLLLLFPDGHLPSRRWRWFSWACGIALGFVMLYIWVYPGPFVDTGFPDVENPIGVESLRPFLDAFGALLFAVPILVVGSAVGLVLRMRRTDDDVVRHQIRWIAYAAAWIAAIFGLAFLPSMNNESAWTSWIQNLSALSFLLIPITIGVAILRYRLYDIDVVIRKTLVFTVMATVIALVYVGLVVGVGALVGSRGSPLLSALAAAVVALVFQPVRTRARRLADRVVYGARATPYEVMATFGDQLAETYASDDVLVRIARVLGEGVGAERARVSLLIAGELRDVAVWPADDAAVERSDEFTSEVRHQGELLGALSVSMPPSDPMNPSRERLVRDLAAQAGLVLRNERLTSELKARLADLQAAQKRLVAAQDDERRRLERNIHDGSQQQLVALQVRQRLAEQLIDRDPASAKQMLEQIQVDTATALDDLRDLARGIYPPLLADRGLRAALEAQARKAAIPVTVEAEGVGRLSQDVEAAVYFSVLEALQNTSKYADARTVTVSLERVGGELRFDVSDDGRGFDATVRGLGTGLQGIADRLGALDGDVRVESSPGAGTRVRGRLPVEADAGDVTMDVRQMAPT
ncbi:MAG TPA: sensor histidine kinase [Actinomycetota bacterium]|nr:sensor histidine kinase [Actinomycetota bacterium]